MSRESLLALTVAYVPQFGGRVARAADERALVRGERQRHHVAGVAGELAALLAGLDVPQGAGHVAGAGQDLVVVEEATAGQVARVAGQLAGDAHVALAGLQAGGTTKILENTFLFNLTATSP